MEIFKSHPTSVPGSIQFFGFSDKNVVLVAADDEARLVQFSVLSLIDTCWHKCSLNYPSLSVIFQARSLSHIQENVKFDDGSLTLIDVAIWNDNLIAAFVDHEFGKIHILMGAPFLGRCVEHGVVDKEWLYVSSISTQVDELCDEVYVSGALNRFVTGFGSYPSLLYFVNMLEIMEEAAETSYSVLRLFELDMDKLLRSAIPEGLCCIVNTTLDTELKAPLSLGIHMNCDKVYIPIWKQQEPNIRYSCIDLLKSPNGLIAPQTCLTIGAGSSQSHDAVASDGKSRIIVGNEKALNNLLNGTFRVPPKIEKWHSCGNCTAERGYLMIGYFGKDEVNARGMRKRRVCQVNFSSGVLVLHQLFEVETPTNNVGIGYHAAENLVCIWNYTNAKQNSVQVRVFSVSPPKLKLLAAQRLLKIPDIQRCIVQNPAALRRIGIPEEFCSHLLTGCPVCRTLKRPKLTKRFSPSSMLSSWFSRLPEDSYIFTVFLPRFFVEYL